jgi:D-arabinono-1,4-lactone oxidase
VEEITLVLADGSVTTCSLENDADLFKAALVSLGSLGVVIRLTMRASPHFNMAYTTETISFKSFISEYRQIWQSAEYVRTWWWPYSQKVIVWRGNRTSSPLIPNMPSRLSKLSSGFEIGKKIYEASLYALTYRPSLIPSFEKALFRSQFPSTENVISEVTVSNPHQALQMECFFSQYVDEWAIPLNSGVEALSRLDNWIRHRDTSNDTGIPFATNNELFVHAPIEIRVASGEGDHAYLSPAKDGPVLYVGVIMYRPYFTPTRYRRYFAAYETLMRMFNGKPHWAKQHHLSSSEALMIFGEGLEKWLRTRERVDPNGVFVNEFVRRHLLGRKGVAVENGRVFKRFQAVL